MGVAVTGNMSSMMPACKWNADTIASIFASLRPLRTDWTFMCVRLKKLIPYIVPILLSELISKSADCIDNFGILCFLDFF